MKNFLKKRYNPKKTWTWNNDRHFKVPIVFYNRVTGGIIESLYHWQKWSFNFLYKVKPYASIFNHTKDPFAHGFSEYTWLYLVLSFSQIFLQSLLFRNPLNEIIPRSIDWSH